MNLKLLYLFIFLLIITACQNKQNTVSINNKLIKKDSSAIATQSVEDNHDLTDEEEKKHKIYLIKLLKRSKQNKTVLLLSNSQKISLAFFPDTEYAVSLIDTFNKAHTYIPPVEKTFHDFDSDGVDELVLNYYSGGANCCNENYIFRKIAKNKFKQIFFNEGGSFEIDKEKIKVSVGEKFSYFYSCYACNMGDSLIGQNIIPIATLKLEKGRFLLIDDVDESRNKKLISYLNKLCKRQIPPLSGEMNFDDGTRKLYALLIMEYFFNNKCDIKKCEKIFFTYYKANDSKSIWIEIKNSIQNCFESELSDFPVHNHFKK